jgi:hypothetical protein
MSSSPTSSARDAAAVVVARFRTQVEIYGVWLRVTTAAAVLIPILLLLADEETHAGIAASLSALTITAGYAARAHLHGRLAELRIQASSRFEADPVD